MGKINIATSGYTPVQVGRILPPETPEVNTPEDDAPEEKTPKAPGTVTNVRAGNAHVGVQADVIHGGLNVRM